MSYVPHHHRVQDYKKLADLGSQLADFRLSETLLGLLPCRDQSVLCEALSDAVGGPSETFPSVLDRLQSDGLIACQDGLWQATPRLSWFRDETFDRILLASASLHQEVLRTVTTKTGKDVDQKDFAVWGTGRRGLYVRDVLRSKGGRVPCFVDSQPSKWGAKADGGAILSPRDAALKGLPAVVSMRDPAAAKSQGPEKNAAYLYERPKPFVPSGDAAKQTLPKILITSYPNAGMSVVERILSLVPGVKAALKGVSVPGKKIGREEALSALAAVGPGEFVAEHFVWSEGLAAELRRLGYKVILILRDPRDIAVSAFLYVTYLMRDVGLSAYFRKKLSSDAERLSVLIAGLQKEVFPGDPLITPFHPALEGNYGARLREFLAWSRADNVLSVRQEDLIGEGGGGSGHSQRTVIARLLDFIGVPLREDDLNYVAKQAFSTGEATFRRDASGAWRTFFSDEQKELFKKVAGDVLIEMGYETGFDW